MNLAAIYLFLRNWRRNLLMLIVVALAIGVSSFSNQSQPWVGRWRMLFAQSDQPIEFILTPDQKAYLLLPNRNAVYELPIEKVSDDATLPENAEIISGSNYQENPATPTGEAEAQTYIATLNRAQQAYRIENSRFAPDIAALEIGISSETSNYRYQVVPQSDDTRSVMMTAAALQPELRSYTGAVFVTSENELRAIVCVSDQPSTTPPAMPTAPESENSQPRCAIGSSVLR